MEALDFIVLRRGGEVVERYAVTPSGLERVSHRPWFLYGSEPLGVCGGEEPVDVEMLVWDPAGMVYRPSGRRVTRCVVGQPGDVPVKASELERRGYPVAMSNVRYEARLSMDLASRLLNVKVPIPVHYGVDELESLMEEFYERSRSLTVTAFDIEVESSSGGFPRPGDPVFLVSICRGEIGGEPECWLVEGPDEVADRVLDELLGSPWLAGFNSRGFDLPYLAAFLERSGRVVEGLGPWGVVVGSRGAAHLDVMEFLDRHGSAFGLPQGRRLALDDAAAALGLASPEELEAEEAVERERIGEEYRRDPGRVRRYALTDALLTWRLARLVLETSLYLYALTGVSPAVQELLPTLGSLAEYAVHEAAMRRSGVVYQVRSVEAKFGEVDGAPVPYAKHTKERYRKAMLEDNVAEYDYNMLYPTIYHVFGLDPAATRRCSSGYPVPLRRGGSVEWVGVCPGRGPLSEALDYFYQARRVSKKLKKTLGMEALDQAIKILANSAYGMFTKGRGMGVHELVGAFIFFYSSHILETTIGFVERVLRRRVVYAATDAIFVKLEPGDDPEALGEAINRAVQAMHGRDFGLKLEEVFERIAIVKPKTYFALPRGASEALVKGTEKLALPRAVKEELPSIFAEALRNPARATAALEAVVASAPSRDLFIRVSRRLSSLYDAEAGRWKSVSNNGTKAVLARLAITRTGRAEGELAAEVPRWSDETVVAYYLPVKTPGGTAVVLYLGGEDPVEAAECRLAASEAGVSLRAVFRCRRHQLTRGQVESLARRAAKPVLEYLEVIRGLRGGLARFL